MRCVCAGNNIGDAGVAALATALKGNTALKALDLGSELVPRIDTWGDVPHIACINAC